jgi:hypothetical protein
MSERKYITPEIYKKFIEGDLVEGVLYDGESELYIHFRMYGLDIKTFRRDTIINNHIILCNNDKTIEEAREIAKNILSKDYKFSDINYEMAIEGDA